jgi:two-component system LytT family response regulator
MREIRALIVDDEPLARRGIRQLLDREPDVTVVGEARNGREALRALKTLDPELVFLDVQMPEVDGFGVLRAVGAEHMPSVIFVTAYDAFAVRAFDAHAIDYLVKPLREARFAEAVQRVRERLRSADAVTLSRQLSRAPRDDGNTATAAAAYDWTTDRRANIDGRARSRRGGKSIGSRRMTITRRCILTAGDT